MKKLTRLLGGALFGAALLFFAIAATPARAACGQTGCWPGGGCEASGNADCSASGSDCTWRWLAAE